MFNDTENHLLTQTGPGTLMGNLMREYWIPTMLSSELPAPNCNPVRVVLLGERLIAFRDSDGRVGLLRHNCPHRGASLFFGRNEDNGIRCVYHGWKFDITGSCIDMPNEPEYSRFKDHVRAIAYRCTEQAGIVWAYMGTREVPPPMPQHEALDLAEGCYDVGAGMRECNWLQGLEGDLDSSHVYFLHYGSLQLEDTEPGSEAYYQVLNRAPRLTVRDTAYGCIYGASRPAGPGENYWRIASFLFPFYALIPNHDSVKLRAWVPMDDTHMMFFTIDRKPPGPRRAHDGTFVNNEQSKIYPNTPDWFGRFRVVADASNDYLIDRDEQRDGSFTGIDGVFTHDQAVTESMGAISNRQDEHLGSSDAMIVATRRRLLDAARELADRDEAPPGVDEPDVYRTRPAIATLPEDADWFEATRELRAPRD